MSVTIEEKILLYPDLPQEERLAVEQYVSLHPQWKSALVDARALDAFLKDARAFSGERVSDEALAFLAASRDLPEPPEELAKAMGAVEERIEKDPELRRRFSEIESRLRELEHDSSAELQFRRLTGRSLEDLNELEEDERKPEPAHIRYLWRTAAAVVILAAAYSILYKIGQETLSEPERLARFDREELVVEGFEAVRQDGTTETSASATAYLAALEELRQAQSSTLGLFPRVDEARLATARTHLQRVAALEPAGSFLSGEAAYLLAKTHLATEEVDEARALLQQVVRGGGRRAGEARQILERLEDEE